MKFEKFIRLEKRDIVEINYKGKRKEVEIKAINGKAGKAFVSLEPGNGDSYRAIWIDYGEIIDDEEEAGNAFAGI